MVIIAKNAQEHIEECLQSLSSFNEVVLYLNNSTDKTEEIAKNFLNITIVKGEFIGFGSTKNKASMYAHNDWILSLDSDEVLNTMLVEEINQQDFTSNENLFILKRDNYFLGKKTISKDYIVRIYNRVYTQFNDNLVHEKVIVPTQSKQIKLQTSFKHHNITHINQTLNKMINYTDLGAENKKICFFIIVVLKATFAFIQTYFLRFYFINGWRGFVIATSNANRRFYKYLKQYINCQEKIS